MENRQEKYLKLREIFNSVIDEEVRKFLEKEPAGKYDQLKEKNGSNESKVIFFIIKGIMFFCNKYQLLDDRDGENPSIKQVGEINFLKEAPIFFIPDDLRICTFWLHLERTDIKHDDGSFFFNESVNKTSLFCTYGEDMLENEEFQYVMTQMIKEIAPERLEEIKQLLQ